MNPPAIHRRDKLRFSLQLGFGLSTGIAAAFVTALLALSLSYNPGAIQFEIPVSPLELFDWKGEGWRALSGV